MLNKTLILLALLAIVSSLALAQTTGTTSVSVVVGAEASLSITTGTTTLTSAGSFANYAGTTNFLYFIRNGSGGGSIVLKITADFTPTGGPSVTTPPTTGDALSYTCTVSTPGTGCSGSVTALTSGTTNVATFGAGTKSAKAGNSGSVTWALTDDPQYPVNTYTATATFTISAT